MTDAVYSIIFMKTMFDETGLSEFASPKETLLLFPAGFGIPTNSFLFLFSVPTYLVYQQRNNSKIRAQLHFYYH